MEVLARSGGRRAGDTIELFAEPLVTPDGRTCCTFLADGVRHLDRAGELIENLRPGDEVLLVEDPDNLVNPLAIKVANQDRAPPGWVPNPLLDYVHEARCYGSHQLTVVQANGPEVGPHLRLHVRLDGHVDPGYRPFADLVTTA